MHNLDMQVLKAGLQWVDAHEVWLCTVLSTYGSSPRPPGAMMIIRKEGHHCGSLSGGCIEESFIERIDRNAFPDASQVVRYGEGGFEPDRAIFWWKSCRPALRVAPICRECTMRWSPPRR